MSLNCSRGCDFGFGLWSWIVASVWYVPWVGDWLLAWFVVHVFFFCLLVMCVCAAFGGYMWCVRFIFTDVFR